MCFSGRLSLFQIHHTFVLPPRHTRHKYPGWHIYWKKKRQEESNTSLGAEERERWRTRRMVEIDGEIGREDPRMMMTA